MGQSNPFTTFILEFFFILEAKSLKNSFIGMPFSIHFQHRYFKSYSFTYQISLTLFIN